MAERIRLSSWGAVRLAFSGNQPHWPPMPDDAYLVVDGDHSIRLVNGGPFEIEAVHLAEVAEYCTAFPSVRSACVDFLALRGITLKWYDDARLERDNVEGYG